MKRQRMNWHEMCNACYGVDVLCDDISSGPISFCLPSVIAAVGRLSLVHCPIDGLK